MNEIVDKIRKIILYKKNEPTYSKFEKTHQMGYISALRDVLNLFGENPYFEIHDEAKEHRKLEESVTQA